MPERISRSHREAEDHHERPPDPAEEADRPLEPKARPGSVTPEHDPSEPPHHRLNRPVGEPDPAADSDPFEPNPEAEDPPPPGRHPGPGPEPDELGEPDPYGEGATRPVKE